VIRFEWPIQKKALLPILGLRAKLLKTVGTHSCPPFFESTNLRMNLPERWWVVPKSHLRTSS